MTYFTFKNTFKIAIVVAIIAFVSFQTYICMAQTPAQPYRQVKQLGDMEIRFYPPAVEASVYKKGAYREMMNNGFRDLAGYIFGGNEEKQKIAMTTPVKTVVDAPQADSGMISFVMPKDFKLESKPTPFAKNIIFHETQAVYTASLTFGGFASREKMEKKSVLLLEMIKKEGLSPKGKVSFLYYNPPFQLFGRRNEVLVEITNFSE